MRNHAGKSGPGVHPRFTARGDTCGKPRSQDAMPTYSFPDVAGTTLVFNPAQDVLLFPAGIPAAALRFARQGMDLNVTVGGDTVVLLGLALGGSGGLGPSNLLFADGSIVILDSIGSALRTGTEAADWIAIDRGGQDTVHAGGGDDRIEAGAAFDALDVIDGGAGTADTLVLSGVLDIALGPLALQGVERIEAGSGEISLALDAATVATATPAPGAVFTVDGSAQGTGSRVWVTAAPAAAPVALLGGAGDDSLAGGFGADLLAGGSGDDTLSGGWGDDTLDGGPGTDVLAGGAGNDLFRFDSVGALSPAATPDLLLDFQGAGREGGDRIALPGTLLVGRALAFHVAAADFVFEGYAESGLQLDPARVGDGYADILWRRVTNEAWHFELWADLNDNGLFDATDLFLRIVAAGSDTASLAASDFDAQIGGFVGGAGHDSLFGQGATDDAMWGESGDDVLAGGDGVDWLDGGLGHDSLFGGDLADELRGGPGNDWLEGGDGFDTLFAADPLTPETESPFDRNMLDGGARPDALFGGLGLDTLLGGEGDDLLWGDSGDDSLDGGTEDDLIYGGEGHDDLSGGDGADTLLGGPGGDTLAGGAGADLFVIDLSAADLVESPGGTPDWIVDFDAAAGDRVSLGLRGGLVDGTFGPGPLAWRGALPARALADGPGFGQALPGEGIGPGYYQAWWQPALAGGLAVGGWFLLDLDQDLVLDAGDVVIRLGGPAAPMAALTPGAFAEGTFRVQVGTMGADTLAAAALGQEVFGLGGDDRLFGGDGDDRLVGGEGNDTVLGDAGADQLWGGAGQDWLEGGAGDDELFAEGPAIEEVDGFLGQNTLLGGLGDDSLWGADGRESLEGGAGNDWLYGGVGLDTLLGGDGNDTALGGDGADFILGGAGADSIDAGAGDDTVDYDPADILAEGGDDTDLLVIAAAVTVTLDSAIDQVAGGGITRGFEGIDGSAVAGALTLLGSAVRNRLIGGAGDDRLEGRDGNDTLQGGAGGDTIDGGAGDDLLIPGPGPDLVAGGGGTDTLSYADATAGFRLSLVSGTATGSAAGDTVSGIEALIASPFDDFFQGLGAAELFIGGDGNDTVFTYAGNDTLRGGAGADSLRAGVGADQVFGDDGNDTVDGSNDNDVIDGGSGDDWAYGGTGDDLIFVDSPGDRVIELAAAGSDTVIAASNHNLGVNIEWLVLAQGAGPIFGVGSNTANAIRGNEAGNAIGGRDGDDTIWGGAGADRLRGLNDNDRLFGEEDEDSLWGGAGNDVLDGGADADMLLGEGGNDSLFGGMDGSADILDGGNGDDWLDGGAGSDVMRGGFGNDTFIASQATESIVEFAGQGWDVVIARAAGSFALQDHIEGLVLEDTAIGIGNALSNRITGDAGSNQIFGRAGNDTLVGGAGDDALFGEAGADSFLFGPGSGLDAIADFVPGQDRILLQGYAGLGTYAAVMAVTRDAVGGAIIDFAPGHALQLAGVQKSALGADDFAFPG